MLTDELDFDLPPELIAQTPAPDRAASRLLHYRRSDRSIEHRHYAELPALLKAGDLLVFNDARVVPARFMLEKPTGGRVEGLFVSAWANGVWTVILKNVGPVKPELRMHFVSFPSPGTPGEGQGEGSFRAVETEPSPQPSPGVPGEGVGARVLAKVGDEYHLYVESDEPALTLLSRVGRMPLPPYIKREKGHDQRDDLDRKRYQTVYAAQPGSIAAPTAGLHFTEPLLQQLAGAGIEKTFITLHVGLGTFKPISTDRLEDHPMHTESYSIDPAAAEALNRAKRDGRRIIAVGTTSARVLESQPDGTPFEPKTSETSIFIYPPYRWKHIQALLTNFHLPRSTLVALVAAMTGIDEQRRIYSTAIAQRYRFFSYGDGMFIE